MKQQLKKSQKARQEKKLQDTPEAHQAQANADAKADEQDRGRITSITIENFKGISDAVEIPIRPITLLFGKNSSGKSTVLQALRYHYFIRHTELESKIGYESSSKIDMVGGHNIDLADFCSLVHRHEKNRKIRVRITYAPKEEGEKSSILWEEVITSWRENTHPDKRKLENTHVESILLGYLIDNEEKCFIASGKPDKDKAVVGSKGKELDPINLELDDIELGRQTFTLMRKGDELTQTNLREGDELTQTNPRKGKGIGEPKKLDAIRHLGPFREAPFDDDKTSQKMPDESQWEKGAGAWAALAQEDSELLEKTNAYMQDVLKLRYSINQPQSQSTKLLHYKDNDEDKGIDIGLSDVGIGISQLIPVVVGALDNCQNSGIFAVEQPELHIHPALQVALGDVFIDAIKEIKTSNRTMLIETHSEHLLLRIMRRMRETFEDRIEENRFPVTPDDVAVLFVESHDLRTIIRKMSVNERGDLVKAWPGGFFEEDIEEVLA